MSGPTPDVQFLYQFEPEQLNSSGSNISMTFFDTLASRFKTRFIIMIPNLDFEISEDTLKGLRECNNYKNIYISIYN